MRAWLALRADSAADDLFQDVWTVFYRRCREWQHRAPMGDESRPVLSFLFRTCHLTLRAHRRLRAARDAAPLEELFDEADAQHERLIGLVVATPESELRQAVDLPRTLGEPPAP